MFDLGKGRAASLGPRDLLAAQMLHLPPMSTNFQIRGVAVKNGTGALWRAQQGRALFASFTEPPKRLGRWRQLRCFEALFFSPISGDVEGCDDTHRVIMRIEVRSFLSLFSAGEI
jgi:hypothetical protein